MAESLKLSLRVIGLAGLAFFAGLFGVTYLSQGSAEKVGQAFIKYQVEKEVRETYGRMADSTYGKALGRLKGKYEAEARQVQTALNDNLPAKIANVIAAMCRLQNED